MTATFRTSPHGATVYLDRFRVRGDVLAVDVRLPGSKLWERVTFKARPHEPDEARTFRLWGHSLTVSADTDTWSMRVRGRVIPSSESALLDSLVGREARASVSLDHDEREGTHYMGDGHDHGEGPE